MAPLKGLHAFSCFHVCDAKSAEMSLSNGHRGSKTTVLTFLFANLFFTAHSKYGGDTGILVLVCPSARQHACSQGYGEGLCSRDGYKDFKVATSHMTQDIYPGVLLLYLFL